MHENNTGISALEFLRQNVSLIHTADDLPEILIGYSMTVDGQNFAGPWHWNYGMGAEADVERVRNCPHAVTLAADA